MGNTIIFGLAGILVLLLISILLIWLTGRKKITALEKDLESLRSEKGTLTGKLAVLEEKCSRIEPLEKDLGNCGKKRDELQEKISKLSAELAVEIEKNKKLEEISAELAGKKALLEKLQATIKQSESKIAELDSQAQGEREKAEEQSAILDRIKNLFV